MKPTDHTPPQDTGLADDNGNPISLNDTLELTFNEGQHGEHSARFTVVWDRGAFCAENEQSTTPLRSISEAVNVRKI